MIREKAKAYSGGYLYILISLGLLAFGLYLAFHLDRPGFPGALTRCASRHVVEICLRQALSLRPGRNVNIQSSGTSGDS